MEKPNRHIWEEDSTHRSVAGDEYDEVWDYAEWLEAKLRVLKCLSAKQAFAASNIISHHHGVGSHMNEEVREFYNALRDYGEMLLALGGE